MVSARAARDIGGGADRRRSPAPLRAYTGLSRGHVDPASEKLIQQTLLGDAIESCEHGVFVTEEYWGAVLAVNDAACRLLGYSREELLGMHAGAQSAKPREEVHATYDEIRASGLAFRTARLIRRDGSIIEIDYWGTRTRVAGIDFLLTVTEPIVKARVVEAAPPADPLARETADS